MKCSSYIKLIFACVSAVMFTTGIPFVTSHAVNVPKLTIQSQNFTPSELPADQNVVLNVSIAGNTSGFLASSFGITYDKALVYCDVEIFDNAGEQFEIIANEEKNIIWFVSANASPYETGDAEEIMFQLKFELSSGAENGGNFPVQFVWKGLDGSSAYWYAEKGNNLISELQQTAENGGVSIHGGSTLNYTELKMNQETTQQLKLYNAAGTPRWLSTNPQVASVDQNGIVTALSPGECNIRVNIDRTFKDCHVIVNEADIYSILDEQPLMLKNPKRDIILEYPDAQGTVLWGSFDPNLIDIDQNGKQIFKNAGVPCMATIYGEYNGDAPMRDIYVEYSDEPQPSSEYPTESFSEPANFLLGDVDQSGELDIIDVIVINKAILGKELLNEQQNKIADYNQDNKINTNDSLAILKKIVGLE
ncbi:MAG: Ig-like domain-containing protein [Oscillospiraceae bacterium]|nr:Ig-like domain-containing protein [Oscillospiraceae bacterium]